MVRIIFALSFIFVSSTNALASPKPIVEIETNMGNIIVELDHRRAPATVANFLTYIEKEFYDGTIFHRVIPDFMIQGGGFNVGLEQKPTRSPIRNESMNGLENSTGTIAMARTQDFDSATSQFYINVKNNRSLDAKFNEKGYTVFGKVIEGLEVVLKISEVPTEAVRGVGDDVPSKPVIIKSIRVF
ncbi:MAG: peptidylprolyl isomerase A, partial [Gammaproteobacteria bacterium]